MRSKKITEPSSDRELSELEDILLDYDPAPEPAPSAATPGRGASLELGAEPSGDLAPVVAPAALPPPGVMEAASATSIVTLEPGLYVLDIGPGPTSSDVTGAPRLLLAPIDPARSGAVEIVGGGEAGYCWLSGQGGVVAVRCASPGGQVAVTALGDGPQALTAPMVTVRRLGHVAARPDAAGEGEADGAAAGWHEREIPLQKRLHIERVGDRVFRGPGWSGQRGGRLRIEAFGVTPLEQISPAEIEYCGFHAGGVPTEWAKAPNLCGSRGQNLPLVGFAIRLSPALQQRFDVIYSGSFCNSGEIGPRRNGEPCRPMVPDDPIEAMDIRIIERVAE